jgi:hypothetical protein
VGGGGGSIGGSGTTNYVPKFTASGFIGNSQIFDNGTNVGIGTTSPATLLSLAASTSTTFGVSISSAGWNNARHRFTVPISGDESMISFNYNGSAKDFASYDYSTIYVGNGTIKFGTNGVEAFRVSNGARVLINTSTDNGVDKLQVSGSMNVSTLATTNNLSVTTNATVGGTLRVTGTTTLGTTNTGALTASSLDVASGSGTFANLYSNGVVQMLGVNVKYRNISATYTATTGDDYFINITSGTFTLNLPTAATPYGQVYVIKNSGAGTITLDPFSTQTIDGSTTVTMNVQNQTYTIIGDGNNWKIVSKYL